MLLGGGGGGSASLTQTVLPLKTPDHALGEKNPTGKGDAHLSGLRDRADRDPGHEGRDSQDEGQLWAQVVGHAENWATLGTTESPCQWQQFLGRACCCIVTAFHHRWLKLCAVSNSHSGLCLAFVCTVQNNPRTVRRYGHMQVTSENIVFS